MAITLKIVSYQRLNPDLPATFTSALNTFSIGRDPKSDWVLPDPQRFLSGLHCVFVERYGNYWLIDHSTNGLFINGSSTRVHKNDSVPITQGDRFQIGDYEIEVEDITPESEYRIMQSLPMFPREQHDERTEGEDARAASGAPGEPQRHIRPSGPIASAESTGDAAPEGRKWFFGIGINNYDEFRPLNNAVKDVQDVIEVLTSDYGFSPDHTINLIDHAASLEHLIDVLDQLTEQVQDSDSLIIYYSGHGHYNKKAEMGFWIPFDAKRDRSATYVRNSTIRDYLKAIRSKHTLLISDSCFSGSLFVRGANRSDRALRDLEEMPSRWAICSGRHDEEVYDGEPGQNSPFARSILDVLRRNRAGLLNVAKLADRVVEQTRSNYEQLPEGNPLFGVGHQGGQFVFHRRRLEAANHSSSIHSADDVPEDKVHIAHAIGIRSPEGPTSPPSADEKLSEMRRDLFQARSIQELKRLRYEIEHLLDSRLTKSSDSWSEARILQESIETAIEMEQMTCARARPFEDDYSLRPPRSRRPRSLAVLPILIAASILGILVYKWIFG